MHSDSRRASRLIAVLVLAGGCAGPPEAAAPGPMADPGRLTLYRLNRAQYDNTVRDLFLTGQQPALAFPADDFGYGFSSIAQVLSLTTTHLDLYQKAAHDLVSEISLDRVAPVSALRLEAETAAGPGTVAGGTRNLWTAGIVSFPVEIGVAGDYDLQVLAGGFNGARARLVADGAEIGTWDATTPPPAARTALTAGSHTLTVELENPASASALAGAPTLALDAVTVTGPIDAPLAPGPGRARIFTCDPADSDEVACAEQILRGFTRRAWRRPIADDELDRLLVVYTTVRGAGGDWEQGVEATLEAALVAPQFLYRLEIDPDPASTAPRALDDWELASRLSYFLWSSMPDDVLLDLAESGELSKPEVLRAQVTRMLRDPKASALVDTLGQEWLYLTAVDAASPDGAVFPDFDEGLRASMRTELSLFTSDILLSGDRSMLDLVDGTRTQVDPRLAAHYGVPAPSASGFAAVDIPDRPGIFGRAGWLTAVSYPTRTSPVRRGKWVLDNLLCEAPAPPPPNVGVLPADSDTGVTESIRDQFEQHRSDPACASCHIPMDGIGYGLENFDGIGRWRTKDEYGNPIDATGTLVTGASFDGSAELARSLAGDPKIPRCMVQKVFTFALGRSARVEDLDVLADIGDDFAAGGYRFDALATAIVLSDPFRYRTPQEAP